LAKKPRLRTKQVTTAVNVEVEKKTKVGQRRRGLKPLGRKLQFSNRQTDSRKFPTAKLVLKSTKDFRFEFSYCTCRK